ncbi:MAG: FAD-dependent oxidoreductase, partial [Rhodospirillaceae bacterium]|nr:FAD-dependent oxidoreductase [Rhodospirillaceae bacterium]
AEGGWAVLCTEQCDIHVTSDSEREIHLWDDRDIPYLARMTDEVHKHDGLAGLELTHMGYHAGNYMGREIAMAPSAKPAYGNAPFHARTMDKTDIADYRRWHRNAAIRGKKAGFDIICVYAGHSLSLPMHFLSPRHNHRTDEYGGSMENRVRLLREVIEETKDAVGDTCGVVVRIAMNEMMGPKGITPDFEGRAVMELIGELPDLWDVNVADWENDSQTSRFSEEGCQEDSIRFVKSMTSKPVVGVGRYTSPDKMVSLIKGGVLDMIGAARPSIADPFLPRKIEEGRPEDIRECIGCNICVGTANQNTFMRCTQNPTMSEEWRRGWHPEVIAPKDTDDRILIVGAGPAGLEAARALGQRGYDVMLAEASAELGGRVTKESRLPGLETWARVRDWRIGQLHKMPNVEIFMDSKMTPETIRETGANLVALATGATWRRDGSGRYHDYPLESAARHAGHVFTPDDVMDGADMEGPVVVYDDDHYYMGGVIAEELARKGRTVSLVTPDASVSSWTAFTLELGRIQTRMREKGIALYLDHALTKVDDGELEIEDIHSSRTEWINCGSVVMVTAQDSNDALYHQLMADEAANQTAGIRRISRIGDCYGPGPIAAAVFGGHRYARELGAPIGDDVPWKRETIELSEVI